MVFMHGMGLIGHILRPGNAFDVIAEHLRTQGVAAFAPRVEPYNPVATRAASWNRHLARIRAETQQDKLNLIGFSTGGLDARYLVSCCDGHHTVASVTTLAAPHRGSALAAYVVGLPGWIRKGLLAGVKKLAHRVYPDREPEVYATVREVTPAHMTTHFNPSVPDHPAVAYFSWAAQAGKKAPNAVSPLLWILNRMVYARDGVNDGFVSVESARWTGYQGVLNADHAQLVGILDGLTPFDAPAFYNALAQTLAEHGF